MATARATRSSASTSTTSSSNSRRKSPPKGATKSADSKTARSRRHISGADTHKTPGKPAKKDAHGQKPSSAQACWPGYEPTPGKKAGEKGSCKPKAHQTSAERKGDQKAAAASKLSGQR